MKISEFLADHVDPWGIYFSGDMKIKFSNETGMEPFWGEHTHENTRRTMDNRELGGTMPKRSVKKLCYGYGMAISLAQHYVPNFRSTKTGRGFAFSEALQALVKEGL